MKSLFKVVVGLCLGFCIGLMLITFSGCGSEPPIEDWINSSVDPIMAEGFKDMEGVSYTIEKTGSNEATITFKLDGAAELALYAQDYDTVKTTWNDMGDSMCSLTNSLIENAHNYGISDITIRANLVNDVNNDLVLLTVVDGEKTYDCVRDGNE